MAQNARRQMSASNNRSGMSKYKSVNYNGVRYFLVPQAKGTYALKTADGKLAGSLPIINAPSFSAAVKQAKRLAKEIEADTLQSNSLANNDAIITIAEYENATAEAEATSKTLPRTVLAEQESTKRVQRFSPTKWLKNEGFIENKGLFNKGMDMMQEGFQDMQSDAKKDLFLGGTTKAVAFAAKKTASIERLHDRMKNEKEHEKDSRVLEHRRKLYHNARTENAEAFKAYKQQLVKAEYQEIKDLDVKIEQAKLSKNSAAVKRLMERKNELTLHVNEFMKKKEYELPEFKAPHAKLPDSNPRKRQSFKEFMTTRRLETIDIARRRNASRQAA